MKIQAIIGEYTYENPQFKLVKDFCEIYGHTLETKIDTRALMVESRGRCNQSNGFIIYFLGKQCYDIFDLVNAIQVIGMRQI